MSTPFGHVSTTEVSQWDDKDIMRISHRIKTYAHEDGKVSMYWVHRDKNGYNRRDVTLSLLRGPALDIQELGTIIGAIPYCGGAHMFSRDKKAEEVRLGESFSVIVWGCD